MLGLLASGLLLGDVGPPRSIGPWAPSDTSLCPSPDAVDADTGLARRTRATWRLRYEAWLSHKSATAARRCRILQPRREVAGDDDIDLASRRCGPRRVCDRVGVLSNAADFCDSHRQLQLQLRVRTSSSVSTAGRPERAWVVGHRTRTHPRERASANRQYSSVRGAVNHIRTTRKRAVRSRRHGCTCVARQVDQITGASSPDNGVDVERRSASSAARSRPRRSLGPSSGRVRARIHAHVGPGRRPSRRPPSSGRVTEDSPVRAAARRPAPRSGASSSARSRSRRG